MSKGLEALKILYPPKTNEPYYSRNERRYACSIIEKELKTLEIIIPIIDLEYVIDKWLALGLITQEEYDLLKEVLL